MDPMRKIRHIMVATDGSETANRALDVAAAIIKAVDGELSILTVKLNSQSKIPYTTIRFASVLLITFYVGARATSGQDVGGAEDAQRGRDLAIKICANCHIC
jgi:nucleotide-binding universal stress UspA family protein